MKKLILVTALAVAASWLLSESRSSVEEQAARAEFARVEGLLRHRVNDLVLDNGMTVQLQPGQPVRPEPPTPPGSIRTVPWNKRDRGPVRKTDGNPASAPSEAMLQGPASKRTPQWFPKTDAEEQAASQPDAQGSRVLLGRLSASEDRARRDLRTTIEGEVANWLAADVPPSWKPPTEMIDAMVQGRHVQEEVKDLSIDTAKDIAEHGANPAEAESTWVNKLTGENDGRFTLYRAGQKLDFSGTRRAQFLAEYRRELGVARLRRLGGGLAVALVGLAVLSGYIKADEATNGYYTNRLRLLAGAGLGAAGVAAYRFLA